MDIRKTTERIILHHADASNCTVEDIDRWHKAKGWCKIGYHFFVDKEGNIYRGREENAVGSHAYGSNYNSIGICAEGRYEEEEMPQAQKEAIKELVVYLKQKYNITKVQKHNDVGATKCPRKKISI
jgi:N-acetyl-anhydromuramyl-L-alanine amidase AmpD